MLALVIYGDTLNHDMLELSSSGSLHTHRQERPRYRKLAMHKYNNVQLREIMDEIWKRQNGRGIIRRCPNLVRDYNEKDHGRGIIRGYPNLV